MKKTRCKNRKRSVGDKATEKHRERESRMAREKNEEKLEKRDRNIGTHLYKYYTFLIKGISPANINLVERKKKKYKMWKLILQITSNVDIYIHSQYRFNTGFCLRKK